MKNKLFTLAGALLLLAVVGKFYAKPVMAQVRATLTQNVDEPARTPFQVNVQVPASSLAYVTIPAGKRLVIDYVSLNGFAATPGPYTEPLIIFHSTVAGGSDVTYDFRPKTSGADPNLFNSEGPVIIYADSLYLAPGFGGSTPNSMAFNVSISGHLITP